MTNIGKYAQASRLTIAMEREADQVAFMVADNGKGFKLDEVLGGDPIPSRPGLDGHEGAGAHDGWLSGNNE